MCLLSLEEGSELSTKIAQTFALADLLNCVYHGPSDGLNPESLEWISAMIFDLSGDVYRLWEEGAKRDSEARGVKAPEPQAAPEA
jgi:hypothetical protein